MWDILATASAFVLPLAGAVFAGISALGRQRGLRQRLREILDALVKASEAYQYGAQDLLTEKFLRETSERLRLVSERDGLKSPSPHHITDLRYQLDQIVGMFEILSQPPGAVLHPSTGINLDDVRGIADRRVENAKRRANTYLRAVNRMDGLRYWTYLRFRYLGFTDRTFGEVKPDLLPWTGPLDADDTR